MKFLLTCITLLITLFSVAQGKGPTWTDPETAAKEYPDFLIQGEYHKEGAPYGVQLVAMGNDEFMAGIFEGGLPGLGMEPGNRYFSIQGARDGDIIKLSGHKDTITGELKGGEFTLNMPKEDPVTLPRIERKSPTLGAEPPEGALVLFDGSSVDAWENGVMENGLLLANNTMSKQHFKSYTAHIEFRTPFKPEARQQGRGNSGIYHAGRWETQILDSFGQKGRQNETGGIYSIAEPRLNMCLPPLTWQTYDVDFTAAKFDEEGKRTAWPRITVKLNGVLIHEDLELAKDFTTAAPIRTPLTDEGGPMFLQDHKNPVYFRNIWVLPK